MSAPLVVNTKDGVCWTRRTVTSSGIALYAPEGVCGCPEFVMATLPELAEHGIVGSADVLPLPVGPAPRTLDAVEDELTGVSLSLYEEERASERLRWALTSAKRGRARLRAQVAELDALELGEIDGRVSAACGNPEHPTWLRKPDDLRDCPWCRVAELEAANAGLDDLRIRAIDKNDQLRARVDEVERAYTFDTAELKRRAAELEAERHSTNEALDDAVQALRARPSCPCPPADPPHQVGCFFDGVPVSPPSERPVDGPSPLFPTVASLREVSSREEPHDSPNYHPYRLGHDMPDGCRLTAEQAERLGNPFLGGGA